MKITYGCQCDCHRDGGPIPVAYRIKRDEQELLLCTRCYVSTDKIVALFYDRTTPAGPFVAYDTLGAVAMLGKLVKEA